MSVYRHRRNNGYSLDRFAQTAAACLAIIFVLLTILCIASRGRIDQEPYKTRSIKVPYQIMPLDGHSRETGAGRSSGSFHGSHVPDLDFWKACGLPNPRKISREFIADDKIELGPNGDLCDRTARDHYGRRKSMMKKGMGARNVMFVMWGQFIDHATSITNTPHGASDPHNVIPVLIDDFHHPFFLNVTRSQKDPDTHFPINGQSALINGDLIYGSTQKRSEFIRSGHGGMMYLSEDTGMPPLNTERMPNEPCDHDPSFHVFGDVRGSENVGLTSIHVLFLRRHNYLARLKHQSNPHLDDEELFQSTRNVIVAELQYIIYAEFLPALLGKDWDRKYPEHRARYTGDSQHPLLKEAFRIAYRWGHSAVPDAIERRERTGPGYRIIDCHPLRDVFFPGDGFYRNNSNVVDSTLMGMIMQESSPVDPKITSSLTNITIEDHLTGKLMTIVDLGLLNILRGRENSIESYSLLRATAGLSPVGSWSDLTKSETLQRELAGIYGPSGYQTADLFVMLLAEDPHGSSMLGPTASFIISDHFSRIRNTNPYHYEWDPRSIITVEQLTKNSNLCDLLDTCTDFSKSVINDMKNFHKVDGKVSRVSPFVLHGGDIW